MSMLRLPQFVLQRISDHAEEHYPNECCGVLLGTASVNGWMILDAVRTMNAVLDSPSSRYAIEPRHLVKVLQEARKRNLEIAGFYHSHPDHPAMWSQIDLAEAHWLGCIYIITEVSRGKAQATNAFLLAGKREEEKSFELQSLELV